MPFKQGSTTVPDGATVTLDASFRVQPTASNGFLFGVSGSGSGAAPSTHGASHVVGVDPISVSSVNGLLPVGNGGTALSTVAAGAMLYASALNTYAPLSAPAAASVLSHTGTGGVPAWVAALAKAQQHASTAYTDAANVFTTTQMAEVGSGVGAWQMRRTGDTVPRRKMLDTGADEWSGGSAAADMFTDRMNAGTFRLRGGANANTVFTIRPQNTAGGSGGIGGITFFDGSASAGSFVGNFNLATGSRNFGFDAFSDRDGGRLPLFLTTQNAAGTSTRGLTIFAGADAGKMGLGASVGVNLGTGVVPSAPLHVLSTSAGAVAQVLRMANHSNTAGSGSELGFHGTSTGAQKYGSVSAVPAASAISGDVLLSAQKVNSGNPLERLRAVGLLECLFIPNGTSIPVGNPVGGGYLITVGGGLKYKGSSGTVTNIAPA